MAIPVYSARLDSSTSKIVWAGIFQTVFRFVGVPDGVRLTLSAEEATIAVAQLTGERVTDVPRLLQVEQPISPWYAAWSVSLEHAVVTVGTRTGYRRTRSALFFGTLPNYGNIAGPRWPQAVVVDTGAGLLPPSFIYPDVNVNPDGSTFTRNILIQRRPYDTFGAVEAVRMP